MLWIAHVEMEDSHPVLLPQKFDFKVTEELDRSRLRTKLNPVPAREPMILLLSYLPTRPGWVLPLFTQVCNPALFLCIYTQQGKLDLK